MNILLTGGLGYIGSHTAVELINKKYNVIIVDNLINSSIETLDKLETITKTKIKFYKIDATKEVELEKVFEENKIDGVMHFAGLKSVGESVKVPLTYYYNNVVATLILSKLSLKYNVNKFVFSSSATVYGNQPSPVNERMEVGKTTNPYGETKAMSERILIDTSSTTENFSVCILRYFNPVGAHSSYLIGENPNGIPSNLVPYVTKVAIGKLDEVSIFGNDYDTIDGTGVRDYIHVVDLAKGHINALEHMKDGVSIYNLGTGKGTSVLQIINTFEKINNVEIKYKIVDRRDGDIGTSFADVSKAKLELDWKAEFCIEDMVKDCWNYENFK